MSEDTDPLAATVAPTTLGERAAIGRIETALFGGDRLVRVGRYEIKTLLGSGAFGKVYRAHDPELHRDVALKVVEARDDDRDVLLTEARVMATIQHPNVAAVHDAGIVDNRVFVVMELVAGGTLRAWLDRPRDRGAILAMLLQAGRGLAAAHAAGVIHRDFKPDNVLVGEDGRARVVDFGLSRAGPASGESAIAGTPAYMAPELWEGGEAGPRADQFAFCVAAWEALYGARPFSGENVTALVADLQRQIVGKDRVGRVLVRGLARDPAARWPAMDALIAALEPRRARWIVPAAAAVAAIAGVAIGVVATRSPDVDPCPREPLVYPRGSIDTKLVPMLDRDAAAWTEARRAACVATNVEHVQSAALLDKRYACLASWKHRFDTLAAALATPDDDLAGRAPAAIADLPPLAACADLDAMGAAPAPPADPLVAAKLGALSDQLETARLMLARGRAGDALAIADKVIGDADTAKYTPLAIEASLWQCEVLTASGRLDDGHAAGQRAYELAMAISDKRSAIDAASHLAFIAVYDTSRYADAQDWIHRGTALIAKLDEPSLDAELAYVEGLLAVSTGIPSEGVRSLTHAIEVWEKLDRDHPSLPASLAMLGSAELDLGKLDDAERHLRDALARDRATLGDEHPDTAAIAVNLSLVEAGRGFYADALRDLDAAHAVTVRRLGPDHPQRALGLLARAEYVKARGDFAQAEQNLAEAERILSESYGPETAQVAQAAMARADALAELGRGKEAIDEAKRAVAIFAPADPITRALADAALARALAADHQTTAAIELARDAASRADASPQSPGAVRGLVDSAYGELAHDPAALRSAAAAFAAGSPNPWRLARTRFALAQALAASDPTAARAAGFLAARDFPRDGDPMLKAAIEQWNSRMQPK